MAEGIENLEIMDTFTDPMKALKSLRTNYVDLVLLDVEMDPITGLQFLAQLSGETKAVLVSAYDKYGVRSYEYRVCDYLLKPVSFNRLATAVNRVGYQMGLYAGKKEGNPNDYFFFLIKGASRYERIMVRFRDLVYLETFSGRIRLYLQHKEKPLVSKDSLRKVLTVLPPDMFMRIHRSFIINLNYFSTYNDGKAVMEMPNLVLPVGAKANYPAFFKWMERHTL